MSAIVANISRAQLQYQGHFAEPAFRVLGNPASLYTNLLKRLHAYGAGVGDLQVNLSVLEHANVTCNLPRNAGAVRVHLNRVDVFIPDVGSITQVTQLIRNAWAAMADTDPVLTPVRHTVALAVWASLQGTTFSRFISGFLAGPASNPQWKPHIELDETDANGQLIGSIRLEPSAHNPDDLFLRLTATRAADSLDVDQITQGFVERLTRQIRAVGLETSLIQS